MSAGSDHMATENAANPVTALSSYQGTSMPAAGEGPIGMIVCPSRELARQTFEVINGYIASLAQDGHPGLRSLLVMGGVDMKTQVGDAA